MVETLEQSCYLGVTRYGMSGRLMADPDDERGAGLPADAADHAAPWQAATRSLAFVGGGAARKR